MYDGIIDYLRNRTYPPFLKLTSNRQIAKIEFRCVPNGVCLGYFYFKTSLCYLPCSSDSRKKCESFFLDKHGELIEGRAKGLERHVLRRGELACVMKFIHEVLGHCSADVWYAYCIKWPTAAGEVRRILQRTVPAARHSACS